MLAAGTPGGDLLVHAFAAPVSPTRRGARTLLTLDVSYPAAPDGERQSDDQIQLAWLALDADARTKASGQNTFRVPASRAGPEPFTIAINDALDLPRGSIVLRIAIASPQLGRQAVVHLPVDVPTASTKALGLTPLVIGTPPRSTTLIVALGASRRLLSFQPTTARHFSAADRLQVYSRITAPRSAEATGRLLVTRAGAIIRQIDASISPSPDDGAARDCRAILPLEGLAPGEYLLEFHAATADMQTSRAVPFTVK